MNRPSGLTAEATAYIEWLQEQVVGLDVTSIADALRQRNAEPRNSSGYEMCSCGLLIEDWDLHLADVVVALQSESGDRITHLDAFATEQTTHLLGRAVTSDQMVLKLHEEAGEVSRAWLRENPQRVGEESADVVLAAAVIATALGFSIDKLVAARVATQIQRRSEVAL